MGSPGCPSHHKGEEEKKNEFGRLADENIEMNCMTREMITTLFDSEFCRQRAPDKGEDQVSEENSPLRSPI